MHGVRDTVHDGPLTTSSLLEGLHGVQGCTTVSEGTTARR